MPDLVLGDVDSELELKRAPRASRNCDSSGDAAGVIWVNPPEETLEVVVVERSDAEQLKRALREVDAVGSYVEVPHPEAAGLECELSASMGRGRPEGWSAG